MSDLILTDKQKERLESALEDFNFEKVHAYMVLTDWKYGYFKDKSEKKHYYEHVPSVEELKETVRGLIMDGYESLNKDSNKENSIMSTGGFTVEVYGEKHNEYDPCIHIYFCLESSSTF